VLRASLATFDLSAKTGANLRLRHVKVNPNARQSTLGDGNGLFLP